MVRQPPSAVFEDGLEIEEQIRNDTRIVVYWATVAEENIIEQVNIEY